MCYGKPKAEKRGPADNLGGRFGKYGDTKRKVKLKHSGLVKMKGQKIKEDLNSRLQESHFCSPVLLF